LIYQATEGNDYQKILLISGPVKGKIFFGNSLGFQAQIEDLHLNYCLPRKIPKTTFQEVIRKKTHLSFEKWGFKFSLPYLPPGQGDWRAYFYGDDNRMGGIVKKLFPHPLLRTQISIPVLWSSTAFCHRHQAGFQEAAISFFPHDDMIQNP